MQQSIKSCQSQQKKINKLKTGLNFNAEQMRPIIDETKQQDNQRKNGL